MDLNELLNNAPQLNRIVTTIVAGVPLAEIVKRVVLPSADALGERMKTRVERCFEKGGKMILDAGVPAKTPPDKIIIEILQGASLEDNEDLHTMWAALLANAASPENAEAVRPGFVAVLKQMSPDEASVLKFIADRKTSPSVQTGFSPYAGSDNANPPNIAFEDLLVCLDGLLAVKLLRQAVVVPSRDRGLYDESSSTELDDEGPYYLTDRGRAFLQACRPPKPKF